MKRLFTSLLLFLPTIALADNCGGPFDCFGTLQLALSTAVGLAVLSIILDFIPKVGTVVSILETIGESDTFQRIVGIIPVEKTGSIDMSNREGAYLGTAKFPPGTVGYGVHHSIGGIIDVLGDFGQAKIGDLFNRPDVQALLAKDNTFYNNYKVAQIEYEYWFDILFGPDQSIENRTGGLMGVLVGPLQRTILQVDIGEASQDWNYAVEHVIDPSLLEIRDDVEQLKAYAQYRMEYLKNIFPNK